MVPSVSRSPGAPGREAVPHSPAAHRASPTSGLRQVLEQQGIPLPPSPQEAPGRETVNTPQDARRSGLSTRKPCWPLGPSPCLTESPAKPTAPLCQGPPRTHTPGSPPTNPPRCTHTRACARQDSPTPAGSMPPFCGIPLGQLSAPWRQTLTRCPEGPVSGRLTLSHPGG